MKTLFLSIFTLFTVSYHAQVDLLLSAPKGNTNFIEVDNFIYVYGITEENILMINKYDKNLNFVDYLEIPKPSKLSSSLIDIGEFEHHIYGNYIEIFKSGINFKVIIDRAMTKCLYSGINPNIESGLLSYDSFNISGLEQTKNIRIGNFVYVLIPDESKQTQCHGVSCIKSNTLLSKFEFTYSGLGKINMEQIWAIEIPELIGKKIWITQNKESVFISHIQENKKIVFQKVNDENGNLLRHTELDISDFVFDKKSTYDLTYLPNLNRILLRLDEFKNPSKITYQLLDNEFDLIKKIKTTTKMKRVSMYYEYGISRSQYYGKETVYFSTLHTKSSTTPSPTGSDVPVGNTKRLGLLNLRISKNDMSYTCETRDKMKIKIGGKNHSIDNSCFVVKNDIIYQLFSEYYLFITGTTNIYFISLNNNERLNYSQIVEVGSNDDINNESYDKSKDFSKYIQSEDGSKILWILKDPLNWKKDAKYKVIIDSN